eukprot:300182-Amorphochlora_amoeboformis.AAC.1
MVEKYHRRGYLPASRHKRFRGVTLFREIERALHVILTRKYRVEYLARVTHKDMLRGGGSLRPGKKPARKGKTGSGSTGGELEVGAFVSIHGLKKMVDLNGATATVV